MVSALFHGCELVFAYAADGAYPVVGEVGKCGSRLDAVVGVSYGRVVYPVANFTYIFLVHNIIVRYGVMNLFMLVCLLASVFDFHEQNFGIGRSYHAVRNALAHEHEVVGLDGVEFVEHGKLYLALYNVDHHLGWRQVCFELLPGLEGQQRHTAAGIGKDIFEMYTFFSSLELLGKVVDFAKFVFGF